MFPAPPRPRLYSAGVAIMRPGKTYLMCALYSLKIIVEVVAAPTPDFEGDLITRHAENCQSYVFFFDD